MLSQQEIKIQNISMKELSIKLLSELIGLEESQKFGESLDNEIAKLLEATQPCSDKIIEERVSKQLLALMGKFTRSGSKETLKSFLTAALKDEQLNDEDIEKTLNIYFKRMYAYNSVKKHSMDFHKTLENYFIESSVRDISIFKEALPEDEVLKRAPYFFMSYEEIYTDVNQELTSNYMALLKPVLNQIQEMHRIATDAIKDCQEKEKNKKAPVSFLFVAADKKPDEEPSNPAEKKNPSPL